MSTRMHLEAWRDTPTARAEWDALAVLSGNVFGTSEWALAWWRHWGAGRRLRIIACRRESGELAAIFPLYVATRRPLRILRFVGHGAGDVLGPVHAPEHRTAVTALFRDSLRKNAGRWNVLLGQQVPAGEGWSAALGARVLRRERSPILTLRWPTWDDYLASRSSNFRQQTRRRPRQLAREHSVRFRLTADPGELQDDLGRLFDLHLARWGAEATSALAPSRQAFHRDFAERALERGWLRLWFLEVDGDAVAAWYGFRVGGVESYYQSGRDPSWEQASVGGILLAHTIQSAFEDGMREYRFLRGGETYKGRYTDEDAELETFALGSGIRGSAAVGLARLSAGGAWSRGPLAVARRAMGMQG